MNNKFEITVTPKTKTTGRERFLVLFQKFTPNALGVLARWADAQSEGKATNLGYYVALTRFAHAARELAKFH